MSLNFQILCFQHCRKDRRIFCFQLPEFCVLCGADLNDTELLLPPFPIPSPFTSAIKTRNAIVIKPTNGDFLNDYQNSFDLHIGVTDSIGNVYEYDSQGIQISKNLEWGQCIPIEIKNNQNSIWKTYWDETLVSVSQQENWVSERYDQEKNNCYSFVLSFLHMLSFPDLEPYIMDKTKFCAAFVVPKMKVAAKYILLYRQLCSTGVKVQ